MQKAGQKAIMQRSIEWGSEAISCTEAAPSSNNFPLKSHFFRASMHHRSASEIDAPVFTPWPAFCIVGILYTV
jgi:hypothetical protein